MTGTTKRLRTLAQLLRESFVSWLLTAVAPPGSVSIQLGHADVAATARHYIAWIEGYDHDQCSALKVWFGRISRGSRLREADCGPSSNSRTRQTWNCWRFELSAIKVHRVTIACVLLLSVVPIGCLSYSARIDVSSRPTDNEVVEVVEGVVARLGFRPDPKLAELRQMSEESAEYEARIIANYVTESNNRRVSVIVGVDKKTAAASVWIRDLDNAAATAFTLSIERQLVDALGARFSPQVVEVKRKTVGQDHRP